MTFKLSRSSLKWVIFYTLLALILAIEWYFRDPIYYYGAIIIAIISFYWIIKEWKK